MISEASSLAFEFVQKLAAELNAGELELPPFPDVAVRVRNVVEDENCTLEKIVRVVGSEPALAAKLIQLANSALLRRGDGNVTDLKTAIGRLGHKAVRNAAVSLAMKQLLSEAQTTELKPFLSRLWTHSVQVSAICYALTKRTKIGKTPDEALLAGLLHGIGKLYIITRSRQYPELFADQQMLNDILQDWHPAIGKAIVEHWKLGEDLAAAIEHHENLDYTPVHHETDLTDVLLVANCLARHAEGRPSVAKDNLPSAFNRMDLDIESGEAIIADSREQIQALAAALA
ncbi:MAG: HDOD domain-containing protein [Pseudomonadota bacterium]